MDAERRRRARSPMTSGAEDAILCAMVSAASSAAADVLDLVDDVEEMDPEERRRVREATAKYGDDFARRAEDLAAGRHPYQQPR